MSNQMSMKMCDSRHERIANITCINLIQKILFFENAKQISPIHVLQDNVIVICLAVGIVDGCYVNPDWGKEERKGGRELVELTS